MQFPQGKAKRATEENLKVFEAKRAELEKAQAELLAKAQERGAKLDGLTLQITQKAGVDGRLFGSVTNRDISKALTAIGQNIHHKDIKLAEAIRTGVQPWLNVYRGVAMSIVGIQAYRSALDRSNTVEVPDFRKKSLYGRLAWQALVRQVRGG